MKTKDVTRCAFALVCLIIASKITIPISFIPITLQTLAVILLALLLNKQQMIMVFTTYLLAGLCGLPIFANGGGISYILQPSFGFLLSFPIAAYLLQYVKTKFKLVTLPSIFLVSLLSLLLIYAIGCIYMYGVFHLVMQLDKGITEILAIGVFPFVLNDVISAFIACVIAKRLKL